MSITFYVSGETPQKKVYCKERFPNLDDSDFEGAPWYDKDDNGFCFMESAWPEVNWSNSNAYVLVQLIGLPAEGIGKIDNKDLPEIRRKIISILNTEIPDLRSPVSIDSQPQRVIRSLDGTERVINKGRCGWYDPGLLSGDVLARLNRLLEVIIKAQDEDRDVCWS